VIPNEKFTVTIAQPSSY